MPRRRTSSPLFPRGPGVGARTLIVLLLAFGVWFADQRGLPVLATVRGSLDWLLQPLYWLGKAPGNLAEAGGELKNYRALLTENAAIKQELLISQVRLLKLDALEAENRRIRQLMASSSALDQKVLIAEIIATSQAPYRHQITLNKGAADGVYFGQAVVDAYGVMGQVIRVNPATAIALLVTDPSHGIPVEVNRTGLQTVARGGGDGRVLTLPFLPGNADVKIGDLLVSSGLGGRFPAGYPVGEVFDIRRTTGEHFMEASAYPSARLNQGRQALLVWSSAPTPTLSEDPTTTPASLATAAAAAAASAFIHTPAAVAPAAVSEAHPPLPPLKYGTATSAPAKINKPPPAAAKTQPKSAPPAITVAQPVEAAKPKPELTARPKQAAKPADSPKPSQTPPQ